MGLMFNGAKTLTRHDKNCCESRDCTQSTVTPAGFAAIDSSPSSRVKKKRKKVNAKKPAYIKKEKEKKTYL
jgi:hypothetical protein